MVKKEREIYYIGNVKFHIDIVPGLGSFVEIEAGNILADLSREQLKEQCDFYLNEFKIRTEDLVDVSYSDMLLAGIEINIVSLSMDFELREPAVAYGKKKLTIEEYLEYESTSLEKHEYYQGEIFAYVRP